MSCTDDICSVFPKINENTIVLEQVDRHTTVYAEVKETLRYEEI